MKREALIVGGSNGIGLSIAQELRGYHIINIVDKKKPDIALDSRYKFRQFDLLDSDYSLFDEFENIDTLIISAGFGRLSLFKDVDEDEIIKSFSVNTIGTIRVIKHFYDKMLKNDDFYCAVMVSVSGMLSSPFFSIYGATKAALCKFIESVNVELLKSETSNRILNISPGAIKGTRFYNGENNLDLTTPLAKEIIYRIYNKDDLFIPQYDEIYKDVLDRYYNDFREFGKQSYEYKLKNKR